MKVLRFVLLVLLMLILGLIAVGQLGWLTGEAPKLGVTNGRLTPPKPTPNSVSSQAMLYPDNPQRYNAMIAPLSFSGDADNAMGHLADLLQKTERTKLVTRGPDYLYAQSTSAILQFTDDVEFWLDRPHNVIQVRSASRLGHGDMGVNRRRIEAVRAALSAPTSPSSIHQK